MKDRNICLVKLETSKNLENYGPSWSGTRATLTPTKKASGNASKILRISNSSLHVTASVSKIILSFQMCKKKLLLVKKLLLLFICSFTVCARVKLMQKCRTKFYMLFLKLLAISCIWFQRKWVYRIYKHTEHKVHS